MAKLRKQPKSLNAMRAQWNFNRYHRSPRTIDEVLNPTRPKKTEPYITPDGVYMSSEYIDNIRINKEPMDGKGQKGRRCNRSACQAPGAHWFNHSTRAYYCKTCAELINAGCRNDQYIIDLGHDLVTYEGN